MLICTIAISISIYTIYTNIYLSKQYYIMYHQQQNKSILGVANLLPQNNITICYYGQVNSLWLE